MNKRQAPSNLLCALAARKIVVLSLTGNIGKSTIVNTLLSPRMPDAVVFRIETINATGSSGANKEVKLRGDQLDRLQVGMAKAESSIVDVGSSNVEALILGLNEQFGSQQFFDYFLVPVLARDGAEKETEDAIKTLVALHEMGVDPDRIKVVFNKLPKNSTLANECEVILNFHTANPIFTLDEDAVIHESEAFAALGEVDKTYREMVADNNNYYLALNEIPMEAEKERVRTIKMARAQGTVKKLDMELAGVFNTLFREAA